jgi:hypothetical protein
MDRKKPPSSSPVIAAATRNQKVLRLRAATRNSRPAMGRKFTAQI